jgi:transmembrane sensor
VASGAAAAVVLVLVSGWASDVLVRLQADHVTATAEIRTLKLEDGSDVSLGPKTALDVAFSGAERRIRLRQGEAFFTVASGDRRPFVVEAGPIEARDIGTAFDVRTDPDVTEVSVQDGIVDVSTPNSGQPTERLQAGESVKIVGNSDRQRQNLDPAQIGTWRDRQLIVDNQPVDKVVDAIRPYYSGAILVQGGRFTRESLTGVYNLADPATALRAVAAAHGASFHRLSPWLIVLNGD